eukprot:scaffold47_cov258-Pinguiococcus_pyrenoidosus.AAC.71
MHRRTTTNQSKEARKQRMSVAASSQRYFATRLSNLDHERHLLHRGAHVHGLHCLCYIVFHEVHGCRDQQQCRIVGCRSVLAPLVQSHAAHLAALRSADVSSQELDRLVCRAMCQ